MYMPIDSCAVLGSRHQRKAVCGADNARLMVFHCNFIANFALERLKRLRVLRMIGCNNHSSAKRLSNMSR